ncbi:MAG: YcxB family protein [Gemmatimonadetes bacterium]|nr:YcxB family protein [Gemmatimonadota bacterium]NNF13616.1 YcxB family protein [Gemmatimonadota bacterium]
MSAASRVTEADSVPVEFDLTPEEWVDLAVEHNRQSPVVKRATIHGQLALGGITVILGLLALLAGYPMFTLAWLLGGSIGVVLLPRLFERAQRKQYADIARGGITNGMFGTHRVSLLDEGIMDETHAYQRLTRWHAVEKVVDGPGSFMIYFGSDAFLPVPHSAFRASSELRAFSDRFFALAGSDGPEQEISPPSSPEPGERHA